MTTLATRPAVRATAPKYHARAASRGLPVRRLQQRRLMMVSSAPEQPAEAAQAPAEGTAMPPGAAPEAPLPTPAVAPTAPVLARGQGTAIITGTISILFGVAYLVVVQLLDSRGGEMLPPPPEAYIP